VGGRGRTGEEDGVLEELLVVGAVRAVEELGEGRLNPHRELVRVPTHPGYNMKANDTSQKWTPIQNSEGVSSFGWFHLP